MRKYKAIPFDIVQNMHGYNFYKLYIDDVCQFDEFLKKIEKNVKDCESFDSIIAYMDNFGPTLIPKKKFNHIKDVGRSDVYEFKKNAMRIYIVKQEKEIYIILGNNNKDEQKRDIKKIKKDLADFPTDFKQ